MKFEPLVLPFRGLGARRAGRSSARPSSTRRRARSAARVRWCWPARARPARLGAALPGTELDLLLRGGSRLGVEFQRADAPAVTRSMRIAADDLRLDALRVVHPGDKRVPLGPGIEAVPLWALLPPR